MASGRQRVKALFVFFSDIIKTVNVSIVTVHQSLFQKRFLRLKNPKREFVVFVVFHAFLEQ